MAMPRKDGRPKQTGKVPDVTNKAGTEVYLPSEEEIARAAREIREKGYRDNKGIWQDRWGVWHQEGDGPQPSGKKQG
jgi:hypothetical protein